MILVLVDGERLNVLENKCYLNYMDTISKGFFDATGNYVKGNIKYNGYHPIYPFNASPDIVKEVEKYNMPFKNVYFNFPPYKITVFDKYNLLNADYNIGDPNFFY